MPIGGENVGQAYVRILADGSEVPDGIRDALSDADGEVEEGGERHSEKYLEGWDLDSFRKKMEEVYKDPNADHAASKAGTRHSRVYVEHWDMRLFRKRMSDMFEDNDQTAYIAGDRHGHRYFAGLRKSFAAAKNLEGPFDDLFDRIAGRAGAATGRGSRNDFLHIIGGVTEGFVKLLLLGPKVVTLIGSEMTSAFKEAGGGMKGIVAAGQSLGPVLVAGALGLASFAATIGLLALALGPVVALMSGLLGIVTALVSTISFGLVGAIAPLIGLLGPLAAGIGVVLLGVTSLDNKLKKDLKKTFDETRASFDALQKASQKGLFGDPDQLNQIDSALSNILDNLRPLVRLVGESVTDTIDRFADSMDSPGFNRFLNEMKRFLPDAIEQLGRIIDNTFAGFGEILTEGIVPSTERFLDWLEKITDQFREWSNTKQGRKEIAEFFKDAGDSAEALGDFIDSAWGLLKKLLAEGKDSGDNIFEKMADAVESWTEALEKNPQILEDWFDNAEELADALGDVAEAFGEVFDTLDSPENREGIILLTDAITGLFDALEDVGELLSPLESLKEDIEDLGNIGDSPIGRAFKSIANGIDSLFDSLSRFGSRGGKIFAIDIKPPNVPKILAGFSGLGQKILNRIGSIDLISKIVNPASRVVAFFSGLRTRILNAIGNVNLLSLIDNPVGRIVSWFSATRTRILNTIGNINLLANIDNPADQIVSWFSGLGSRIVSAIGSIDLTSIVHLPNFPGVDEPWNASGGLYSGPTRIGVGEAGPEAVVPLNRPLSLVDPAVRALSAFAQGLVPGTSDAGRRVDASGWTIVTPSADPEAAAAEVLNRLVPLTF